MKTWTRSSDLRLSRLAIFLGAILAYTSLVCGQTAPFTYQGRLDAAGQGANGTYDFTFTLYTTNAGGASVAGPATNLFVAVTNGLFTTPVDFGPGVFTGANYWLEVGVRSNGVTEFSTLAPRQPITAVPYALHAADSAALGGQSASDWNNAIAGQIATATNRLSATVQPGSLNLTNWSGRSTNNFVPQIGPATNLTFYDRSSTTKLQITNQLWIGNSPKGSNSLSLLITGVGTVSSDGYASYQDRTIRDVYNNSYQELYNPTHDVFPNYPSAGQTNFGMEMQVTMSGGYAFSTAYGYGPRSTGYTKNRRPWQWGIGFYGQPYIYHQESAIYHTDNTNLSDSMYPEFFLANVYTNVGQKVHAGGLSTGLLPAPAIFFSGYDILGSGWWRWFDSVNDVDDTGHWSFPGQPRFAIITGPSTNAGVQITGAIRVNGLQGITTNQIIGNTVWQISSGLITSIAPIDSDLDGFFGRMGAVSTTATNAMITFVATLKADGTWTNIDFLYPMIGNNIGSNCLNLITNYFNGVPTGAFTTADATGVKSDGTGYIDTTWRGTNSPSNCGIFVFLKNNSASMSSKVPMGARDSAGTTYIAMTQAGSTSFFWLDIYNAGNSLVASAAVTPVSMLIQRTSSTSKTAYVNGVSIGSNSETATTPPACNVCVCAMDNNGTAQNFFDGKIQVAAGLRTSLSASQAATLHNACAALNAALGR